MKGFLYKSLLLLGASLGVSSAATCTANNNCGRVIYGTAQKTPVPSSRLADCNSFLKCTFTPPTFTSTIYASTTPTTSTRTIVDGTSTVTTTYTTVTTISTSITSTLVIITRTSGVNPMKRANTGTVVCPTKIPTYASVCTNSAQYSSACSCLGATRTTTTVTSPTAYVYSTLTFVGSATFHTTTTSTESDTSTFTGSILVTATSVTTTYLPCPSPSTICDGVCTDTSKDPINCGSCGFKCASGSTCSRNTCLLACTGAFACRQSPVTFCNNANPIADCFCVTSTNSGTACADYDSLDGCDYSLRCTADSDCADGSICWTKNCCGFNFCLAVNTCGNPYSTMRIFKRGGNHAKKDPFEPGPLA